MLIRSFDTQSVTLTVIVLMEDLLQLLLLIIVTNFFYQLLIYKLKLCNFRCMGHSSTKQ